MSLILAIESDRRQAARITAIARELNVELIVTESAERALEALRALAGRTPDLILTPQLMSPRDESAINDRLRELDAAGLHVQTLMIPVLASSGGSGSKKEGGLLKRLRRGKEQKTSNGGCDPSVFATQISEYLERAAEERAALSAQVEDEREYRASHPQPAPEPFVYEPRFGSAEPAPVVESAAPEPDQTSEPEPFVYEPSYASSAAEPFAPAIEESPVASQVVAEEPASGAAHFLSESDLSSLELEPVSEVSKRVDAGEPRPDMIGFLDSMLDPAPDPVRPPDVSRIDVSAIVELDDVAVNDSNTSTDELFFEEAIAARAPAEGLSAVPPAVDGFAREVDDDIEKVTEPRTENSRDVLADFVEFDELGVMDGPGVALGEFEDFGAVEDDAAFAKEAQSPRPAVSVLDLELLDDPGISHTIEASHRRDHRADAVRTSAALEAFFDEHEPEPAGSEFDFEGDLFTPLPVAAQRHWPRPEGPSVKAALFTAPPFDAPPDPGVEFAPMPPHGQTGKKKKSQKPAQDEWGLFDPAQCGFAALLAKLDEVTDNEEAEQHTTR